MAVVYPGQSGHNADKVCARSHRAGDEYGIHSQEVTHKLELTWLRDMDRPYDLGDNEIHLAMQTDDMDAALAFHKEMDCVCFENPEMGIYFINDPDGYWVEICPAE